MKARHVKVEEIMRVGPKYATILNDNGIFTALDLLNIIPKDYVFIHPVDYDAAMQGETITIIGRVVLPVKESKSKSGIHWSQFQIVTGGNLLTVVYFKQRYLQKLIIPGRVMHIRGKIQKGKKEFLASEFYFDEAKNFCVVKYSIEDISNKVLSSFIRNAINMQLDFEDDPLPNSLVNKYNLQTYPSLYERIHFPQSLSDVELVKKRLRINELMSFYIKMHYFRHLKNAKRRQPREVNYPLIKRFIASLPFELTSDQKLVISEVFEDFAKPSPMNRLVQGDVGSGKTIIGIITALACVDLNYQVALLVPTEVLATQHFNVFKRYLESFNMNIGILSSSTKKTERQDLLKDIKNGYINILIGTHALLVGDVEFHNLGLVIVDEQQRFGVRQRSKLLATGNCDAMYLTATPIPRSLFLTILGDLDISSMRSALEFKHQTITKLIEIKRIPALLSRAGKLFAQGMQGYFIVPYIESEAGHDIAAVSELVEEYLPLVKYKALSSRTSSAEKSKIFEAFKNREIDLIIATTVIEVGIDFGNANLIVVFDAERFGLCQLHQLRGRVGRAGEQGYACFVTKDATNERLVALETIHDGFTLSEIDLKLRGAGEYFGLRQSGIPEYIFEASDNVAVLSRYSDDAKEIYSIAARDSTSVERLYVKSILKDLGSKEELN